MPFFFGFTRGIFVGAVVLLLGLLHLLGLLGLGLLRILLLRLGLLLVGLLGGQVLGILRVRDEDVVGEFDLLLRLVAAAWEGEVQVGLPDKTGGHAGRALELDAVHLVERD